MMSTSAAECASVHHLIFYENVDNLILCLRNCVTPSEAQGLDLMCVALGDGGTGWALDSSGSLWFRTGVTYSHPQGEDDHWWQVKSSDFSF